LRSHVQFLGELRTRIELFWQSKEAKMGTKLGKSDHTKEKEKLAKPKGNGRALQTMEKRGEDEKRKHETIFKHFPSQPCHVWFLRL